MNVGARVLKTGIAVTLALYLGALLQMPSPIIAAVASIFAIQPSIYRSWRYFMEQLQANTIGAVLAMAGSLLFRNEPIAIGIISVIVILICIRLKIEDTIGLAVVTVIAIMDAAGSWHFALNRFLLILIGITTAFVVNIFLFPPKPKERFFDQVQEVFTRLSLLLRTIISDEMKETVFQEEKESLERSLNSLSEKYKLYEEEQKKLKRGKLSHIRLLVVYKQMLSTLEKGTDLLGSIKRHYFQAERTPEIDNRFDRHLESLIKYHEHVLLKFDDKVKPDCTEFELVESANEAFMRQMMDDLSARHDGSHRLGVVAASMYDYGHRIERLDKIVVQYSRGTDES